MFERPFIEALRGDAGVLPPGPRALAAELADGVHRARLIAAMADAAAEKGYGSTTIADVVARAQVSRRTFYEHFADKNACFLAAYDASADLLMALIAQAVQERELSWQERITAGVSIYLHTMANEPGLTRLFLIDVLSAGSEALARRRAVHQRFADLVENLVNAHLDEFPSGYSLAPAMATAIIGAVNELVLLAVEDGCAEELPRLADTASRLVWGALAPSPSGGVVSA